jgi:hypothetical protein
MFGEFKRRGGDKFVLPHLWMFTMKFPQAVWKYLAIPAMAMSLSVTPMLVAQSVAPSAASGKHEAFDPRDLSGQWSGGLGGGLHTVGKIPPLLPDAQAKFAANTA